MRTRLAWRVRDAAEEWLLAQARQAREAEWCRWAIRKRLTPLLGRRFYDEVVAADDEDARMAALWIRKEHPAEVTVSLLRDTTRLEGLRETAAALAAIRYLAQAA